MDLKSEIEGILDKSNSYPDYLEKGHLTDGSEECFWEDRNKKIANRFLSLFKRKVGGLVMEKEEVVISLRCNHSGICPKCSTYIAPPFDGWCPKCKKQTIGVSRNYAKNN